MTRIDRSLPARLPALDALRGAAMLWMTAYHFFFDLNWRGWIHQAMLQDPFWTVQRTAIVSLFLLCAGAGQVLAVQQGTGWPRFWRRWTQVAACALAVSVVSWVAFGHRYIYFGVLHGMAVMLIVLRLLAQRPHALWGLAILCMAAPLIATPWLPSGSFGGFFQGKPGHILGLVAVKPNTEDYVPLLPWLGVMALGGALLHALPLHRPRWWSRLTGPRWLSRLGQWSLSYYMVHQPVLLGLLWFAERALRR